MRKEEESGGGRDEGGEKIFPGVDQSHNTRRESFFLLVSTCKHSGENSDWSSWARCPSVWQVTVSRCGTQCCDWQPHQNPMEYRKDSASKERQEGGSRVLSFERG